MPQVTVSFHGRVCEPWEKEILMADLIVLAFDSEEDAEGAYNKVQELQHDLIVQLSGLALVKVDDDGKTHVDYPGPAGKIGAGAAGGALFGIIGTIFAVPVIAVGNVMVKYIAAGEWKTNPTPTAKELLPDA